MATGTVSNAVLADRIGVSNSMASRLLNGERLPGLDTIQRISEVYEVPLARVVSARNDGAEAFGTFLRQVVGGHGTQESPS